MNSLVKELPCGLRYFKEEPVKRIFLDVELFCMITRKGLGSNLLRTIQFTVIILGKHENLKKPQNSE